MTLWISMAALLVSAASLTVSIVVAVRNARIQKAQIRTELLSTLVDLRLEYARFNRRIRKLKENPPSPIPKEIENLMSSEGDFRGFERKTESYRQALLGSKQKMDSVGLEKLRHHIEALLKQLADDNKRLDDFLGSDEAVERKVLVEQFDALRRRVLYVGIANDLAVELHELRKFIIERDLVDEPAVRDFFAKWLTNPMVILGKPVLNVFSKDALEELRKELSALRI